MLASHIFRLRTSVHSRKATVDSAFICPLYRGRVAFDYRVLYIVTFFTFAALSQRCFYLLSAYLVMYVVDLYLCQWPPILYCLCGALPARYWFSTCCYSNSYISYSFSLAYRRRVSQLISLGIVPLQGALIPYIRSSVWCIFFFTRQSCTVNALYIMVASIYIYISGTAALRFSVIYNIILQAPVILHRY